MNNYKTIITILSLFLASSIFVSANAAKPGPVPQAPLPYPDHTVGEIREAFDQINAVRDRGVCVVQEAFLASGAQNYRSDGDSFSAIGPWADLYVQDSGQPFDLVTELNNGIGVNEDTVVIFDKDTLEGTHYKGTEDNGGFRAAPVWEFGHGRIIAQGKDSLPSPDGYIDWLNVFVTDGQLSPNTHTYNGVFRVLTIGGVAPVYHGQPEATVGSPYTTIYLVVDCDID